MFLHVLIFCLKYFHLPNALLSHCFQTPECSSSDPVCYPYSQLTNSLAMIQSPFLLPEKKIAFCTQEKWLGSENSHTSNFCNAMWVLFSWNYGVFFMNMVCEMGLLLDNLCFSNGIQFVTEGFAYTSSLSVFLGNWSSTVIRTKIGKPLSVYCREIPTLMFKQVLYLNPQFAVLTKQFGQ